MSHEILDNVFPFAGRQELNATLSLTSSEQADVWGKYKKLRNQINNRIKQEEIKSKKEKVAKTVQARLGGLAKIFMEWTCPGPPTQLEVDEKEKITLYTKARDWGLSPNYE